MQSQPTGRVHRTGEQSYNLVLTRRLAEPPEEVWHSFADPDQAAAWIGRWDGSPGTGSSFDFQMLYEEGQPHSSTRVVDCTAGQRVRVLMEDEGGSWDLEIRLWDDGGATALELIQHLADPAAAEDTGPGWEYYLDRLAAARTGGTMPDFDDRYLDQGPYYAAQARAAKAAPAPS